LFSGISAKNLSLIFVHYDNRFPYPAETARAEGKTEKGKEALPFCV